MFTERNSLIKALEKCALFSGVDDDALRRLLDRPGCGVKQYHEGALIAFRGDRYDSLMLMVRGSMTAEFQDFRGKVLKVESIREGESAAAAILFAAENLLPVTLTAEKDCYIFYMPKAIVFELMQRDRAFLENIVTDMGDRVSTLADKIYSLQFSTIKQKIAAYLLDLADKQGTDSPELRVTKEVLAEIFGVTRPALSRCFSDMARDDYFVQEGRIVHIKDKPGLKAAVEEE